MAVVARQAEALGFDSLWVGGASDHASAQYLALPGSPDGRIPDSYSWFLDPFVTLARASAVTTKLKLGTGITLIPERNPLLLAKEIATLDYFSGGRFYFGIGAGWNKEETEIMGGNFTHRWTQTREAIEAMKALWANEAAEYHGTYHDFPWCAPSHGRCSSPILRSFSVARRGRYSNGPWHMAMAGCPLAVPQNSSSRAALCSTNSDGGRP